MEKVFDMKYVLDAIPHILTGIPVSLSIAAVAFFFGLLLGFI